MANRLFGDLRDDIVAALHIVDAVPRHARVAGALRSVPAS